MKKTSMPNAVKSLGYIKCYSSSSPRPIKIPQQFYHIQLYKEPKTILEIRKKGHISLGDQRSYYLQVFQRFTNHRKKIKRAVVFSYRPFLNVGTTDETFQHTGKQDFFRHLFKS